MKNEQKINPETFVAAANECLKFADFLQKKVIVNSLNSKTQSLKMISDALMAVAKDARREFPNIEIH